MIISGFPGIGKSYFAENSELLVKDSDSSKFSWKEKGVRDPDFPNNYIEHIKANVCLYDVILISSHHEVRQALQQNMMEYVLIYPHRSCKQEYIDRYSKRGSPESFLKLLDEQWDTFIDQMFSDKTSRKYILTSGRFLSDIITL